MSVITSARFGQVSNHDSNAGIEHFPSCNDAVAGRAVSDLLQAGSFVTWASLAGVVENLRESGEYRCDCYQLRLIAADNAVRLARAAWRAHPTDVNAQRVVDLTAARDAVKLTAAVKASR